MNALPFFERQLFNGEQNVISNENITTNICRGYFHITFSLLSKREPC